MASENLIERIPPPGQFIQVQDYNIHYEKYGTGDHVLLLFPGAMGSTRADFPGQMDRLDHNKFTIVAFDVPGQGYSRPPDRKYPEGFLHDDADVAWHFVKKLNIPKVSVLGWCYGGATAIIFAAKYPQVVHKLVILNTSVFVTAKDLDFYETIRDISAWTPRERNPLVGVYGYEYLNTKWGEFLDALREDILEKKQGDICKKEVCQVTCPTLIVYGKKDALGNQLQPDFLRKNIKNSRYAEYELGKHHLHFQFEDRFNSELEEFLLS